MSNSGVCATERSTFHKAILSRKAHQTARDFEERREKSFETRISAGNPKIAIEAGLAGLAVFYRVGVTRIINLERKWSPHRGHGPNPSLVSCWQPSSVSFTKQNSHDCCAAMLKVINIFLKGFLWFTWLMSIITGLCTRHLVYNLLAARLSIN